MKRLFFVRHGQTDMNISGTFSGQTETSLTKEGREQAKLTGKNLKKDLPKIDLIICSPFERAVHTAEIIANELGYPKEKIQQNPLFIERHFGVLEGTLGDDFFKENEYRDIDSIEGAETIEQLHNRAVESLAYLKNLPDDNILVVSHGSFGRAIRRVVNELPHTHEYEEFKPIGNAEVLELI